MEMAVVGESFFGFAKDKELVWGGLPKACGHLYA
jgi:hypothetical protein